MWSCARHDSVCACPKPLAIKSSQERNVYIKILSKSKNIVWHQQKARFEYVLKCFHLAELWFWMIMIYHGWSKVGRSESVPWRLGHCQAERAWLLHTIVTGSIPSPHSTHAWWVFSALNALFEYLIATLLQHFLYLPVAFHQNCQDDDDEDVYAGELNFLTVAKID